MPHAFSRSAILLELPFTQSQRAHGLDDALHHGDIIRDYYAKNSSPSLGPSSILLSPPAPTQSDSAAGIAVMPETKTSRGRNVAKSWENEAEANPRPCYAAERCNYHSVERPPAGCCWHGEMTLNLALNRRIQKQLPNIDARQNL
jgi:hypothetical protein